MLGIRAENSQGGVFKVSAAKDLRLPKSARHSVNGLLNAIGGA